MKTAHVLAGIGALATASAAFGQASVDLKVTEMWVGVGGPDHTTDWFEVTNFSDSTAYTLDTYFADDSSANPTAAKALTGITSIAPGESVIFLMDVTLGSESAQVSDFRTVWGLTGSPVQVGYVGAGSGLGLGTGGDAVSIFAGNTAGAALITAQSYPALGAEDGYASFLWNNDLNLWDNSRAVAGVWGAYNSLVTAGDLNAPAVGSPGVHIPAPGAMALIGVAGLGAFRRRR